MKCFIPGLLLLSLLSSCVAQEGYYETGYYAPPPPRVEIHPSNEHRYNTHSHSVHRRAPQVRVHHGSVSHQGTAHGNNHSGRPAPVINKPSGPQIQENNKPVRHSTGVHSN